MLADRNYTGVLLLAGVRDPAGNPLTGANPGVDFFVLAGDANHDRKVDFTDLVTVAQNYNATGRAFAQGDFDYDGAVGFTDLVILAQRYNTVLPPLAAPPVSSAPAMAAARSTEPAKAALFSTVPVGKPVHVTRPRSKSRR